MPPFICIMAVRKPTLFQQAQKELRRIEKTAKRMSKRGYEFDLPYGRKRTGETKTRYTRKEVEALKQVKAKDLYKYATAFGYSGEEYRKIERSRAAQKGVETKQQKKHFDFTSVEFQREEILREKQRREEQLVSISRSIIENFLNRREFLPEPKFSEIGYEIVVDFINQAVSQYGYDAVAQAIQLGNLDGTVQEIHASYDSNVKVNLQRLARLLKANENEFNIIRFLDDESYGYNNTKDRDSDDGFLEFFG